MANMFELTTSILYLVYALVSIGIFVALIAGWIVHATVLRNIENNDKQEKEYQKYLRANNFTKNDYCNENKSDIELELCNSFLQKHSNNIFARERRAYLYLKLEQYENSIKEYKYLMKKKRTNFDYVSECANVYATKGQVNEAFDLINNFYTNKTIDARYYIAEGKIFESLNKYDLALKSYNSAIEIEPNNYIGYGHRSFLYKKLNQTAKSNEDWKKQEELLDNKLKNLKENLKSSKDDKQKTNKKTTNRTLIIKIILCTAIIFYTLYCHPTGEYMKCNSKHMCTITRVYFNIIKVNKNIKLNKKARLTCNIRLCNKGKHSEEYGLYIKFDGIAPFVFYVSKGNSFHKYEIQKQKLMEVCKDIEQEFEKHLDNHSSITIHSKANTESLFLALILITFIIFGILRW